MALMYFFAPILNLKPFELLKTISKNVSYCRWLGGHIEGDQLYLEHNNNPKHAVVSITTIQIMLLQSTKCMFEHIS